MIYLAIKLAGTVFAVALGMAVILLLTICWCDRAGRRKAKSTDGGRYEVVVLDPEGDRVDAIEYLPDGKRLSLLLPVIGSEAAPVEAWVMRSICGADEERHRGANS